MKKIIFLLLIILLGVNCQAQFKQKGKKPNQMIEEIKIVKLIEILELDEETQIRFFSRRNQHLKEQEKLIEQRYQIVESLEKAIEGNEKINYEQKVKEVNDIENQIVQQRNNFYKSLSDILDYEKIAKLIIFEIKFNERVKDLMFKSMKKNKN
ncbi:MAG: hypothetical protein JW866_06030 [Ignavibacteriales bacterium]|nr:hypothetical protein [Ignavibacteriales bacterium]